MTGEDFYYYIDRENRMRHTTLLPVNTVGEEEFFYSRGVEYFWRVDRDNPQSILKALSEALEAEVESDSLFELVSSSIIGEDDVREWLGGAGLRLEPYGESSFRVSDGLNTVPGSTPLTALLNWYCVDVETDDSNDEEE